MRKEPKIQIEMKNNYYYILDIRITAKLINFSEIAKECNLHVSTIEKTFKNLRSNPKTIRKIRNACLKLYKNSFRMSPHRKRLLNYVNNISVDEGIINS